VKRCRPRLPILLLTGVLASAWAADTAPSGIPRFHQVNEHVYRGGQPPGKGWDALAKLGVKTVIDLRPEGEHSTKAEARAVEAAGMRYVNLPLKGMQAPPDEKISAALALLDADSAAPVFVHCRRGADRTGAVIACYRIAHDHWANRKALDEAKSYGMSWVQFALARYVLHFQPASSGALASRGLNASSSALATPLH
jgi:tyrosine-protein phosphatase SIW14